MTAPALYYDLGSPYAYLATERAERVLGTAPESVVRDDSPADGGPERVRPLGRPAGGSGR